MDTRNFPLIPHDLLRALEEVFPHREIRRDDTIEELKWQGGQRSVIQFLRAAAHDQNNQIARL